MLDTSIKVKTDYFDGPLSLLLLLVQKEEMDIRNLDLNSITKQYLGYLAQMRELNFDVAGDYLYLAATLLLLKSKRCITEDEVGLSDLEEGELNITSQAELIRRLEELQKYQKMGQLLWSIPKKGYEIFTKPKVDRKTIINSILTPMDLDQLTMAMMDLISKEKRKYTVIKRDRLSIKEKLQFLKEFLVEGETTELSKIIDGDKDNDSIINVVITFISLLELARLNKVTLFQNELYGTVYVDVVDSLASFDIALADGFEEEEELEAKKLAEIENAGQPEETFARTPQMDGKIPAKEMMN